MSMWTHITSCLSVDTCITNESNKNVIASVTDYLAKAPKITGSESNAEVFVNIKQGHNHWEKIDCEFCEHKKDDFKCGLPQGERCKVLEYQSCVVITVQGDLRDRDKQTTSQEFKDFFKYIEKEYIVRDFSINIEEG